MKRLIPVPVARPASWRVFGYLCSEDHPVPLLVAVIVALLFLSGCATQPIFLKHPVTGQPAQCGPYTNMHPIFPAASPHWKAERECINDFQQECEQGRDAKVAEFMRPSEVTKTKKLGPHTVREEAHDIDIVTHGTFLCLPDTVDPRRPKGK